MVRSIHEILSGRPSQAASEVSRCECTALGLRAWGLREGFWVEGFGVSGLGCSGLGV